MNSEKTKNPHLKMINQSTLRKLQLIQTEILADVDRFCRGNGITYSMAWGTLLGAVRHHGSIPWDDDIDIMMERNNYEKFIKLWRNAKFDKYYLQDEHDYKGTNVCFTKVRLNGSIMASKKDLEKGTNQGIWIDIFPVDKVPSDMRVRIAQSIYARLRIIATVELQHDRHNTLSGVMFQLVQRMIPNKLKFAIRRKCYKRIIRYRECSANYDYIEYKSFRDIKRYFPNDLFDNLIDMKYEGYSFMAVKDWDSYLKKLYGDYMILPPENERINCHDVDILRFCD